MILFCQEGKTMAGDPVSTVQSDTSASYDVAVVGAELTGLAARIYLRQTGFRLSASNPILFRACASANPVTGRHLPCSGLLAGNAPVDATGCPAPPGRRLHISPANRGWFAG